MIQRHLSVQHYPVPTRSVARVCFLLGRNWIFKHYCDELRECNAALWFRWLAVGKSQRRDPVLILGQSMWWTKWHWHRFLSEYFGFPVSIILPMFHTHFRLQTEGQTNEPGDFQIKQSSPFKGGLRMFYFNIIHVPCSKIILKCLFQQLHNN